MTSYKYFNNRELSWLSFNNRVLQEAQDKTVPLLQRLRFLGIFANNQDEFIKVRVANLKRMLRLDKEKVKKITNGYTASELLDRVNAELVKSQYIFNETYKEILSQLNNHGIFIINEKQLSDKQLDFCRNVCMQEISQWLVPVVLRKTLRIPFLSDNQVYFAVKMSRHKVKSHRYAIIQIPVNTTCKRLIELPSETGRKDIIFIDDIVRLCLKDIFFMFKYDSIEAYSFSFIRDAELTIDDDVTKSLIEKMQEGIEGRIHGEPVRLVYDRDMPEDLLEMLASKLKLIAPELMAGERYLRLRDLMKFPTVDNSLENTNPPPVPHPCIVPYSSMFQLIRNRDILLNYPYHSFSHIVDFLREAAIDPKVKKISITLYRTAERSKVINALINAVKNGKEVVVMEELKARFDEEQNIENSDTMQKAGITVINGFQGLKVHSKLILVERKENGVCKGYVYVGTGNFNESTARIYGDFGLLTSDPQVTNDAKAIFDFLQNTHKHFHCKKLIVSPYYMRKQFEQLIEKEIKNKQKGKEAYIYAKFNALTDTKMIKKLYKASQHGVKIKLIIRSACCLKPQVKGISENIEAISIVDKYLEHARLMIFHNDGDEQIFISSADWMTRNLDNRIEVGIPITDKDIRQTLKDFFDIQWADNVKARDLSITDGNIYRKTGSAKTLRSQNALYTYYESKNCTINI